MGTTDVDVYPDEACECGECNWQIYDVDRSEVEGFDDDDHEDDFDEDTCEEWD